MQLRDVTTLSANGVSDANLIHSAKPGFTHKHQQRRRTTERHKRFLLCESVSEIILAAAGEFIKSLKARDGSETCFFFWPLAALTDATEEAAMEAKLAV